MAALADIKLFFSVKLKTDIPSALSSHCFKFVGVNDGKAYSVKVVGSDISPQVLPVFANTTRY